MRTKRLLAVVGLVLSVGLGARALAQRQFEEWLAKRYWPADFDASQSIAAGDVDGDADTDVVIGNYQQNRLYLNLGGGIFQDATAGRLPEQAFVTEALALGDVDGDGDLDLVVGTWGQNRLQLNEGDGTFVDATAERMPRYGTFTSALALGDVDGDLDLDLVLAESQNRLYVNDGRGIFTDVTATRLPVSSSDTREIALGDVDGDSDLDIVLAAWQQELLYLNDGSGAFIDATAARMPAVLDNSQAVALGDVDGDLDLDVVVGNDREQNRLYLNDGTGTFTDVTAARLPADVDGTYAVALGDVDGDGDRDLLMGNGYTWEQNRLYVNDGAGTFADVTIGRFPLLQDPTRALAVTDVDGDLDLEVLVANLRHPNRLYVNDGTGSFADGAMARLPLEYGNTLAVALGDVDGDADQDLVLGNYQGQNLLYRNEGTGVFTDVTATAMPPDADDTSSLALGDVDGDRDLDLVIGNGGYPPAQSRLYSNDGTGKFADVTATRLPANATSTQALALGDLDRDGDLDIVLGNRNRQTLQYANDGTGAFTDVSAARMPAGSDDTWALAIGDVDGDGDLDLVLGNFRQQNRLYLNDGRGVFTDATAARLPPDADSTRALALGDVDADGDLDLLVGNGHYQGQQNRLYLNDGSGAFTDETATRLPAVLDYTVAVAFGALDGDRDLDLVVGNLFEQNRLYLNDGTGEFRDATAARLPADADLTASLALGDVDGDEDVDLVLGNGSTPNALYLNLHRQLSTPVFAALGRSHPVDLHAKPGYGTSAHTGVVFVGTGLASTPIRLPPLGTFFLNPAPLAALPPVGIAPVTGTGRTQLSIPALPSLLGVELYLQALITDSVHPLDVHLTGYTVDAISR